MTDGQKLDKILLKLDIMENEIKETKEYIIGVEKRLDEKIGGVEERLNEKIDRVEERLNEKIDGVEERLNEKIDGVEERLNEKIDNAGNEVKIVKLIIENEMRENIKRIAEGHLDVSRHVHDVMNAKEEFEMLAVRVNILETAVQEINRKIS